MIFSSTPWLPAFLPQFLDSKKVSRVIDAAYGRSEARLIGFRLHQPESKVIKVFGEQRYLTPSDNERHVAIQKLSIFWGKRVCEFVQSLTHRVPV